MTGPIVIPWEDPAWIGLRHFNDRDYFEAHDVWEEIWMTQRGPSKIFYQGMIQAAVGCYKADFNVYNGAVRLLERALGKFETAGPVTVPFDLDRFIPDLRNFLRLIEERGPEGLLTLVPEDYPVIWTAGEVLKDAVHHGGVLDED
jgi:hypothetical protein